MKLTEAKRRVSRAIRALKGAPLIEDLHHPMLVVEKPRIVRIMAEHESLRPDADRGGLEIVEEVAKRHLLAKLAKGLEQSGAVQILEERTSRTIIYRATIRAVVPAEEE